jgi:magnesium transporter
VLRLTPGALTSNLLEQRPADPPPDLCVHGGIAPTHIDLVVFQSDAPVRRAFTSLEGLEALHQLGEPLWVRIRGLADRRTIHRVLDRLQVPAVLAEPLMEVPQRPQVDCLDDAV